MRFARYVAVAVLLIVVTLLVSALGWRAVMQARVKRATAITTPNGVEFLEKATLGGVDQWLLIRGWDRSNPVLLHLHGGPGSADIAIVRLFDTELIQDFKVVPWDQRGDEKRGLAIYSPSDSIFSSKASASESDITPSSLVSAAS
jgi:hypothetical protein